MGDLHLTKNLNGKHIESLPFRVYDMLQHLNKVVNFANENKVDYFLFGGDSYDTHSPNQRYKVEIHKALNQLNMETIILVGNHDTSPSEFSKDALYEFTSLHHDKIKVVREPEIIKLKDNTNLLAIPWCYEKYEIPEIDRKNTILIGHFTVPELVNFLPTHREFTFSLEELKDFKFVLLSHIHKHIEHENIIYPGSVGKLDWGEFNNKTKHGFLYFDGKELKHVPYKDRTRHYRILKTGKEKLPPVNEEAMYRFVIYNNCYSVMQLQERYKNVMSLDFIMEYDKINVKRKRFTGYKENMTDLQILEMYFNEAGQNLDKETVDLFMEIQDELLS